MTIGYTEATAKRPASSEGAVEAPDIRICWTINRSISKRLAEIGCRLEVFNHDGHFPVSQHPRLPDTDFRRLGR